MVTLNNPLPVSLAEECKKALKIFNSFCVSDISSEQGIPDRILKKAKGFAILSISKVGFIVSARAGSGIVIARLEDGSFSAPSAIGTVAGGIGFQAGIELAEFVIVLNSRASVDSFKSSGSLTLGGNLSIALGPVGRNVEGSGTVSSKGRTAALYSYSKTKGLFGGASIEGSVIVERSDANSKAYGYDVKVRQLLSGEVEIPRFAEQLVDQITRRTSDGRNNAGGSSNNNRRESTDEELDREDRTDGEESAGYGYSSQDEGHIQQSDQKYSFGSSYAAGGNNGIGGSSMSSKLSGMGGKLASLGSSIGNSVSNTVGGNRSRSNTTSSTGSNSRKANGSGNRSRSNSNLQPPLVSNSTRFAEDFGDEYSREVNNSSPSLLNRTRAKRSDSYTSFGEEGWKFGRKNSDSSDKVSSKMTKTRSDSVGLRDKMVWGGDQTETSSTSRESFDSLDERSSNNPSNPSYNYNNEDLDSNRKSATSSPFRIPTNSNKFSSNNNYIVKTPIKNRSRSNSNLINNSSFNSTNASPFSDNNAVSSKSNSTRPTLSEQKSYSTKPWESEDEDLLNSNKNNNNNVVIAPKPQLFTSPSSVNKGDPLDFSQVDVDFTRLREGMVYAPSPSNNNNKTTVGNRSRSSTVGKGIGQAVALFDFKSVEAGDLPFKKGDVITILKKDDAEWFTGRLKLAEGIFPRNYVEEL